MTRPILELPSVRPQNLGTAEAFIKIAKSQIGYKEVDNNSTAYSLWYGLNHQPWCYIFMSWVAAHSGCGKIIPRGAYTPAGAAWFKAKGQYGKKPKKGALHFVYHASMGRIGHIEVVTKVNKDGSFYVIGGNTSNNGSRQGDGVYRLLRRSVGAGSGFGYPKYKPYTP